MGGEGEFGVERSMSAAVERRYESDGVMFCYLYAGKLGLHPANIREGYSHIRRTDDVLHNHRLMTDVRGWPRGKTCVRGVVGDVTDWG